MIEFPRHRLVLRAEWVAVGAMLLYAAYVSAYSTQKHWTFQTTGYDLSLYIQSLWNTLHGDFLRLTIAPGVKHFLSWYFTPSVVLLTPVYALWPSPVTLLVVQSVVVALGAWPIFQLVKEHPDAIVSAQNQLAPHVSNRRTVYVFPYIADADYVFLDSTLIAFLSYNARDAEEVERITRQLLSDPRYTIVLQQDGYLLLKRIAD